MSISRRLLNLARSELNTLLDKAARRSDDVDNDGRDGWSGLENLSDAELEAEIARRKKAREEAASAPRPQPRPQGTTTGQARPGPSSGPRPGAPPPRPSATDDLRKAYAALEVPYGADFATVRRSYRVLMRKYHPDRHTQSPEKQKAANELAQKLTAAYDRLEQHLRK